MPVTRKRQRRDSPASSSTTVPSRRSRATTTPTPQPISTSQSTPHSDPQPTEPPIQQQTQQPVVSSSTQSPQTTSPHIPRTPSQQPSHSPSHDEMVDMIINTESMYGLILTHCDIMVPVHLNKNYLRVLEDLRKIIPDVLFSAAALKLRKSYRDLSSKLSRFRKGTFHPFEEVLIHNSFLLCLLRTENF